MLGTALKLLRPSYALTALLLFGAWQGYSFVKSIPERLPLLPGSEQEQPGEQPVEAEQEQSDQMPSSPTVAAIQRIHPGMRILYWLVMYVLLCFATVPLIKKMLACESNMANAVLIIIYSGLGLLSAFGLAGFQFAWTTAILLILALAFSAGMIIWVGGELERIRVEENFG